jgi:Secretion system C-terminal sorting domain/FG-GAP-like repeat
MLDIFQPPTFADIDDDGDMDAFIGETNGHILYYKNTGTALAPVFAEQTGAANPFNGITVGSSSTPTFADIDRDGDMDAFIGARAGTIKYYINSNTPLPVELTAFSASVKNNNVLLNWRTATEVNNYGFEIQKLEVRSQNAEWTQIGFVNGYGNSNSPKEYSFTDKPDGGTQFSYRLKQIDNDGKFQFSKVVEVSLNGPVMFSLEQNYPNPFNPSTKIKYSVAKAEFVTIKLYNTLGEEVATLVNEEKSAGNYKLDFNASGLPSGVYIYEMRTNDFTSTKKMLMLK